MRGHLEQASKQGQVISCLLIIEVMSDVGVDAYLSGRNAKAYALR